MRLSLIVAVAENGVIGNGDQLPWRLSADLRRFKRLTMGHHLLVGRKTWESIGRPLPGRTMVVVTRQEGYVAQGCRTVGSLEAGVELARAAGETELFVAGGGEIYRLALPLADRLYLTRVHAEVEGDVRFPDGSVEGWVEVESECVSADEKNEFETTFSVLDRPRQIELQLPDSLSDSSS